MKILIIGGGRMGLARAGWLAKEGGCDVLILEPDESVRAQFLAQVPRSSCVDNVQSAALLGARAAVVSVPPAYHHPNARQCLEQGLHVLIEKPSTLEQDEGIELARIAKDRNLLVVVGYHNRVRSSVVALKRYLEDNHVIGFVAWWVCGVYARDWWMRRDLSGGGFFEQGCHFVDLLHFLFGRLDLAGGIVERQKGSTAESASLRLSSERGHAGVFFYSSLASNKDISLRIFTPSSVAQLEGWNLDFLLDGKRVEAGAKTENRNEAFDLECMEFLCRIRGETARLPLATLDDAIFAERLVRGIQFHERSLV
jgi:predicted dehydrogenase